jgi:hypothetical protein
MAAKKKTRTRSRAQETTFRHLWLAGLGALAVTRRETHQAVDDALARVGSLKRQAGKLANDTQANVRVGIASVRGQAKASQFSAEVETRLAPVLAKLGLKPGATKVARDRKSARKATANVRVTPARKKAVARRPVRRTRA